MVKKKEKRIGDVQTTTVTKWNPPSDFSKPKLSETDEFQPTKEEALGKIALHLAETKDNKILTDLDSRTINELSILLGISEQLGIETYKNICHTYMRLRVSNKRLGRKELLEIAKSVREEEMNKMQRFRNFFHL
jgi:hypothetical protein